MVTAVCKELLIFCNRHGYAGIAVILNGVYGPEQRRAGKNPRLAQGGDSSSKTRQNDFNQLLTAAEILIFLLRTTKTTNPKASIYAAQQT